MMVSEETTKRIFCSTLPLVLDEVQVDGGGNGDRLIIGTLVFHARVVTQYVYMQRRCFPRIYLQLLTALSAVNK